MYHFYIKNKNNYLVYRQLKKVYEAIRDVKDHCYTGASGWSYDDEHGFQVIPDNAEALSTFTKAHPIFTPFANKGSPLYEQMAEMCPRVPKGMHVFNVASSLSQLPLDGDSTQSISQPTSNDFQLDDTDPK